MNEVVHLIFSNQVVQHFSGIFPSVEWFDPRFNEPSGTGPHDSTNQTDPKLLVRFRVLVDRCCFFFTRLIQRRSTHRCCCLTAKDRATLNLISSRVLIRLIMDKHRETGEYLLTIQRCFLSQMTQKRLFSADVLAPCFTPVFLLY